jgi:hypothetical protein
VSETESRSKKLLEVSAVFCMEERTRIVPSTGNVALLEDFISRPLLGVVGHEPTGAQGDDSRRGGQAGGSIAFQSSVELCRLDQVRGERHCSLRRHVVRGFERGAER